MFGRSYFRLLLLLYPSWFRDRFGVEMLTEFDASRTRFRARRATSTFWCRIILDFFKTIPRAWWHSLMVRAETQKSPTERKRQVLDDLRKDVQLALRGMLRQPGESGADGGADPA